MELKQADKLTQEEIQIEMENLPVIEVSADVGVQTDIVEPFIIVKAPEVAVGEKTLLVE